MRFRYVNEAVGTFVLLGLLLLAGGLVLAARGSGWFDKDHRFAVKLPPQGAFGLRSGAEVHILGTVVGRVTAIDVDADGNMLAQVAIAEDFGGFVRTDSIALVTKSFGVARNAFLEISKGTGPSLPPDGVVDSVPSEELPELVEQALGDIRSDVLPAVRELRVAAEECAALAADLRNPAGNLQQVLSNAAELTDTMNRGDGAVGRLLHDPTLAERLETAAGTIEDSAGEAGRLFRDLGESAAEVRAILEIARAETEALQGLAAEARGALDEVHGLLADTRVSTAELPRLVAGATDTVAELPGVLLQTQSTLRSIERLVRGMQGSWLFGGSAEPAPRGARLSPAEAGER